MLVTHANNAYIVCHQVSETLTQMYALPKEL